MDNNTAVIIVVALFALIVVGGFFVYRRRSKVSIKSPLGQLDFEGSDDPPPTQPGVVVEDATSQEGGLLAEDRTGRGASVKKVNTKDDILVSSESPKENTDPKA